jgi:hypothetical protein
MFDGDSTGYLVGDKFINFLEAADVSPMVMISWKNHGSPEFLRNMAHLDEYLVPSYSFHSLNR